MTRKSLILAAGMVALLAAAGQAAVTWQGDVDSNWSTAGNWDTNAVPGSSDDVIIPAAGVTFQPTYDESTNTTIQSLDVRANRVLTFAASKTLTVTGLVNVENNATIDFPNAGATLVVSGADMLDIDPVGGVPTPGKIKIRAAATVRLSGASSTGNPIDGQLTLEHGSAVLDIANDVKVIGNGFIRGSNATSQITIASGKTFTNAMAAATGGIRGVLKIAGASAGVGTFTNQGRVEADGGVLEILGSLSAVNDSAGTNRWVSASTASSELKFSEPASSLAGQFVDSGHFNFQQSVATSGNFTFNCGATAHVATGATFDYGSITESCSGDPFPDPLTAGDYSCTCE